MGSDSPFKHQEGPEVALHERSRASANDQEMKTGFCTHSIGLEACDALGERICPVSLSSRVYSP